MSIVRVKQGIQCVTFDHENQTFVTLTPGAEFDSSDPFVKTNAWAFGVDSESEPKGRKVSVKVEDASAAPGAKR
jgi:hypothetical protein